VAAADSEGLATLEPLSFVTVVDGHVRSRQERDEYRYFKHFEDWSNGFILLVAIMLEIFKLPALAAAQLRFYQEVVDANETYDFHQSVIKFAIQWTVAPEGQSKCPGPERVVASNTTMA
jgi:hypothetical protein